MGYYIDNNKIKNVVVFTCVLVGSSILLGYVLKHNIDINVFFCLVLFLIIYLVLSIVTEITSIIILNDDFASVLAYFRYPFIFIKKGNLSILSLDFFNKKERVIVPNLRLPQNKDEFNKISRSLYDSFMYPAVENILLIIFSLWCMFNRDYIPVSLTSKFYFYFILFVCIVCCVNNLLGVFNNGESILGEKINTWKYDKNIFAIEMFFYSSLSFDFKKWDKTFILSKISEYFNKKEKSKELSFFDLKVYDFILYKYLSGKIEFFDSSLLSYMDFIIEAYDIFINKEDAFSRKYLMVYGHIILYLIKNGRKNEAEILLYRIGNQKNKLAKYIIMRSRYLLGDENSFWYISNPKNYVYPDFGFVNFFLTNLVDDEKIINKRQVN